MESKNILNLFDEFLSLSWKEENGKDELKDSQIFPKIFVREYKGAWTVQLLPIGTKIIFPSPWPEMWSQFHVWGGSRVMNWWEEVKRERKILTNNQTFGINFFFLSSLMDSRYWENSRNQFEEMWEEKINSLFKIGTLGWRSWIKEEHGIELKPWILENFENESKEI